MAYYDDIIASNPLVYLDFYQGGASNNGSLLCTIDAGATAVLNSSGGVALGDGGYLGNTDKLYGGVEVTVDPINTQILTNKQIATISGWFKLNSTTTNAYGVNNNNNTDNSYGNTIFFSRTNINGSQSGAGNRIYIDPYNGQFIGTISTTGGSETSYISSGTSTTGWSSYDFRDDKWHHFAITYNGTGTAGSTKLYIDGDQVTSTTNNPVVIERNTSTNDYGVVSFGQGHDYGPSNVFKAGFLGDLDEVCVFDTELSGSTIQSHYYKTKSLLTNEITSYSPEQYYPLTHPYRTTPVNFGNGGSGTWTLTNEAPTFIASSGPKLDGAWRLGLSNGGTDSTTTRFQISGTTSQPVSPELTDGEFSAGLWFKTNFTLSDALSHDTFYTLNSITSNGTIISTSLTGSAANDTNKGKVAFNAGGTFNFSANRVDDQEWHYLAIRFTRGATQTTVTHYIDGTLFSTYTFNNATGTTGTFQIGDNAVAITGTGASEVTNWEYSDIYITPFATIGPDEITAIYNAGLGTVVNNVNYPAYPFDVTLAEFVMPTHTAESVINVTVNADPSTASAEMVHPASSADVNLDAFGVATASAEKVMPAIDVTSNVDYAADPQTASADMVHPTVSTEIYVDYFASPATASALLSANVFFGQAVQDTSYSLTLREIDNTTNINANNGFDIGTQWTSGVITDKQTLAIKANSGFPIHTELVKVKINPAHVTVSSTNDVAPLNTFDVYVFTADPGTTFDTMTYGNIPAKEFVFTTRLVDDGSNTQFYLDLTPAFADSRAHTYGVFIEANTANAIAGTQYDRTTFTGTNLQNQLLYVLTTSFVNKNINADIMTASAVDVMPSIYVERFVDYSHSVATGSADFIDPDLSTSSGVIVSQNALLASAEAIQPAFQGDALPVSGHLEAFIESVHPDVAAQQVVNYTSGTLDASAYFHMPQTNIGEVNTVDHMNASALMVDPLVIINRTIIENPAIANATFVEPVISTQLLGTIYATPMTASALSVLPSNFIILTDDPWYVRQYAQHSTQKVEAGSSGNPGPLNTYLKLFSDLTTEINPGSATKLINQMPRRAFQPPNSTESTTYGATAFAPYGSLTPTPRLSPGYLDVWNRPAARLENISFDLRDPSGTGIDSVFTSDRGYTLEFIIRTTKQNQILAWGANSSGASFTQRSGSIGLLNGKLYGLSSFQPKFGSALPLHPLNVSAFDQAGLTKDVSFDDTIVVSNKSISDGQWHHIVIQYGWDDARFQIWIDGNLDIQRSGNAGRVGCYIRPSVLGFNNTDTRFASDFEVSGWSYAPGSFLLERELDLNYIAATKSKAYEAEPMVANATLTSGNKGKGNRGRMLMLYWWPEYQYNPASDPDYIVGPETFDNLDTIDYDQNAPEAYYGWDVYPIDVTGLFLSDMLKPESYGGEKNIRIQSRGGQLPGTTQVTWKINRRGYFRDTLTDMPRYINLQTDLDLADFDVITFKNFPEDSSEVDAFARNEFVDSYFGVTESKIYEDFVKSLRDALDTGIGLYITNRKLAIDLGIIDRVEIVEPLRETEIGDAYANTIVPTPRTNEPELSTGWWDNHYNNRLRIVNTIEDLTDTPVYAPTDSAYYEISDVKEFGGIDRDYNRIEWKPNGYQVGDTFLLSSFAMGNYDNETLGKYYGTNDSWPMYATPIANIKAGKAVTAFANTYRRGTTEVENPYRNHAVAIVVQPGDILGGRPCGGRIFVNFTENLLQYNDQRLVDLVQDEFINKAYDEGKISLERKNELINASYNLDRRLAAANGNTALVAQILKEKYWTLNGDYVLRSSGKEIEFEGEKKGGISNDRRAETLNKFNPKTGRISTSRVTSDQQWFTFEYGRQYPTTVFNAPSFLTLGFWWLSDKTAVEGLVIRTEAKTATATMVQPVVVADKDLSIGAPAMVAAVTLVNPPAYTQGTINIVSLPMNAVATFGAFVRNNRAEPMTANALMRPNVLITAGDVDEVVVYIDHVDPIVYLREEVIK